MAVKSDIVSPYWGLSTQAIGEIVQGINHVAQCIDNILETQKGTDPLRPDFGIGLLDYVDQPINIVVPALTNEITTQVETYEPRATITSITNDLENNQPVFNIEWEYKGIRTTSTLTLA